MFLTKSIIFVLLFIFSACATTHYLPQDAKFIDVPFFKQDDYQCGPSALATVVNYWYGKTQSNTHLSQDEIIKEIYSPGAGGTLTIDLELYAERLGFSAEQYSGGIEKLRTSVDKDIPPIILVDYGFSVYQVNHFMVVTGYTEKGIILNTGRERNKVISNEELIRIWEKTGFWTLVIKPSDS
jgi:predicted double-glycine peptidase